MELEEQKINSVELLPNEANQNQTKATKEEKYKEELHWMIDRMSGKMLKRLNQLAKGMMGKAD